MEYVNSDLQNIASVAALQQEINNKQEKLVSGYTVKTVDGESILGSGNIPVARLKSNLEVTRTLGGIQSGTVYVAGTPLETILRDLLS